MTRENAIYYLQSSGFSEEQITAIEQAFKDEPYGKLVLSHSEISGQIYAYIGNEKHNITKEAIEAVQAVKALEQEPCEMTAEEYRQRMIQAFHNADCGELIAVCVLPTEKEFEHLEWLLKNHYKKEHCDDAISREDVLDEIIRIGVKAFKTYNDYSELFDFVDSLPSVSAEKTGLWRHYEGMLICSECGTESYDDIMEYCGDDVPKRCPECGAKMEG